MMLKKTALTLALSLGLVAGASAATTTTVINILPAFSGAGSYSDLRTVFDGFRDIYTFSLTTPLTSAGSVISLNTGAKVDLTFTSVDLYAGIYGGANSLIASLPIVTSANSSSSTGSGSFAAGSYFFDVQGFGYGSDKLKGAYIVGVDITAPVPEPETYAMLLAGLGLMGTIARRRKSKAA